MQDDGMARDAGEGEANAPAVTEGASPTAVGTPGFGELLGAATWLLMASPLHRHVFICDFEWMVLPALQSGQFMLWRRNGEPAAFATWAFLSQEREARVLSGVTRLAPSEWNCGPDAWLIDLVAPFGGGEQLLVDLKKRHFEDRPLYVLRRGEEGRLEKGIVE